MRVSVPLVVLLSLSGVYHNLANDFNPIRFTFNLIGTVMTSIAWIYLRRDRVIASMNIILYSALVLFGCSVLLNGGVKTPNYIGFLGISVLASMISSTRFIWGSYLSFMFIGGLCLISPLYDPEAITFPPDYRYYTIYGVLGFVIALSLVKTRESFNQMVTRLEERESLLSSVFESITDPLLIFNERAELTYLNESAQRLNVALKQSLGHPLVEVMMFEMSSKEERSLQSLINESSSRSHQFRVHLTLNRSTSWYSISISPYSSSSISTGSVVIMRDITEQQRLTQNQKMSAVGRLSNGIAHDFNNMLGAIKSANDLLKLDIEEEYHDLLEMIEEATDRSANLIKQLRLFSKRSDSEEQVISLGDLIADVGVLLQSVTQHSHLITIDVDDEKVLFSGVKDQLHSMLMNLGLNGLQAMTERGTLTFRLRVQTFSLTDLRKHSSDIESGQYVVIEVSDEGLGISPDLQEQIFEPFFTTHERGEATGLGLSMVHGAVLRHRGVIEVVSQVGRGTTMRVLLPHDELQVTTPEEQTPVPLCQSFDGLSVLVIDDESLIRQSLGAMLKSLQIKVDIASDGYEGLKLLRENAQSDSRYDLVILDMLMPGKNGHEVFLELQTFAPDYPVLLSSGYYPEEALEDMLERGLVGQLHKPYGLKDVQKQLSRVFQHRRMS